MIEGMLVSTNFNAGLDEGMLVSTNFNAGLDEGMLVSLRFNCDEEGMQVSTRVRNAGLDELATVVFFFFNIDGAEERDHERFFLWLPIYVL
jgi:hypothetical protein